MIWRAITNLITMIPMIGQLVTPPTWVTKSLFLGREPASA